MAAVDRDTQLLDHPNAVREFLQDHGLVGPAEPIEVAFLSGGVSSIVARACSSSLCIVVKQALPQLKVAADWFSRVERSFVEARCATVLAELVPGSVPRVLAVDEAHCAFAMTCTPPGSTLWKEMLMRSLISLEIAEAAGHLLGQIHVRSSMRPDLRKLSGTELTLKSCA